MLNHITNPTPSLIGGAVKALAVGMVVALAGCDLNLTNPNAPTEETVLTDADGIISLAVGMQSQMAGSMLAYVRAPALLTDEWAPGPRALADVRGMFEGQTDPGVGIVGSPYQATYRIIRSADNLIDNARQVGLPEPTATGIIALAKLHKAMALGYAILHYQQVPIEAEFEGGTPRTRDVVLEEVVSLLRSAEADLATVTDADLAGFRARVLDANFDLRNTVQAMLARYLLIAGRYQEAIDAAENVAPNVLSAYSYTAGDRNPVQNYAFGLEYIAPLWRFVEEAESGDQRVEFWVNPAVDMTIEGVRVTEMEAYSDPGDPFPVYLPGEMLLIRAEAHARLGNLEEARRLINEVRTQCESPVNEPTACLDPLGEEELSTVEDILAQIAYERRYELFQQGLRWEDLRRLGEFVDRQPKAAFLPIPQSECLLNPNVPAELC
jgi:starch-binding outer membrane protein, SusD/RagB family